MPTSSFRNRLPATGFSLIELIVALSILALIAGLAAPAFSNALDRARIDAAVRQISNSLKLARRLATSGSRESVFLLDTEGAAAWIDDATVAIAIPKETRLLLTIAETERQGGTVGGIRFFPDGSSTGGTIELHRGKSARSISVDWLTGRLEHSR